MKIENTPLLEYTATSSMDSLEKAVHAMCKHRSKLGNIGLDFSMWKTSKGGPLKENWIVNHPDIWSDEPVFPNQVVFYSNYWRISDEQINSEIMTNPRWRDIVCEANRQLIDDSDGSTACLFLEGFRELDARPSDGVTFIELVWGS
jgi:hypothetical protein